MITHLTAAKSGVTFSVKKKKKKSSIRMENSGYHSGVDEDLSRIRHYAMSTY